jgi:hypothetical protein
MKRDRYQGLTCHPLAALLGLFLEFGLVEQSIPTWSFHVCLVEEASDLTHLGVRVFSFQHARDALQEQWSDFRFQVRVFPLLRSLEHLLNHRFKFFVW